MIDINARFQQAVQSFWTARDAQKKKNDEGKKIDAGTRGAVTGGSQMGALEVLIVDLLEEAGLKRIDVKTRIGLELPGYYRPEKRWDLLVMSDGKLITALEFKSQVGSFGNNFNNRVEESIGNATDIWTAFREKRLGPVRPFLGYFFLLEDSNKVHKPVKVVEPYFKVDKVFKDSSYSQRYQILCQRLILERLYDVACLTMATNENPTRVSHPIEELNFRQFAARLQGHVKGFVSSGLGSS